MLPNRDIRPRNGTHLTRVVRQTSPVESPLQRAHLAVGTRISRRQGSVLGSSGNANGLVFVGDCATSESRHGKVRAGLVGQNLSLNIIRFVNQLAHPLAEINQPWNGAGCAFVKLPSTPTSM